MPTFKIVEYDGDFPVEGQKYWSSRWALASSALEVAKEQATSLPIGMGLRYVTVEPDDDSLKIYAVVTDTGAVLRGAAAVNFLRQFE